MHRPPLRDMCLVSKSVCFVSVCVCGLTAAPSVQSACQPSQTQSALTGTGERVSLARSRQATPPLPTYGDIKTKKSYRGGMSLHLCQENIGNHLNTFPDDK